MESSWPLCLGASGASSHCHCSFGWSLRLGHWLFLTVPCRLLQIPRFRTRPASGSAICIPRSANPTLAVASQSLGDLSMGLWDKITGELVDIIEWLDETRDTMVWRFPRYENQIKNGAKLIIRESQVAAFVR